MYTQDDKLTRNQAIDLVGADIVENLDYENCDFESSGIWTAHLPLKSGGKITAVYYMDDDAIKGVADLSDLTWTIDHYRISDVALDNLINK